MTPLYTESQFIDAKYKDKLPLKCEFCYQSFYIRKKDILNPKGSKSFCSQICYGKSRIRNKTFTCKMCNKNFTRREWQANNRNENYFCNHSCAALYSNKHKTKGNRRSKLEIWLESELSSLYPNLNFLFNNKQVINSELDIYIPSLCLAFELNGLFHYEPIFGNEKLEKIKNNDERKFQACLEHNIELCIINTTEMKYFKQTNAQKYLNIIHNIIERKINGGSSQI